MKFVKEKNRAIITQRIVQIFGDNQIKNLALINNAFVVFQLLQVIFFVKLAVFTMFV